MPHKRTNYLPLVFLPVIIILCFGLWAVNKSPIPDVIVDSTAGVFDLRDFDFQNAFALTERNGEYIPDELLTPQEFAMRDDIQVGPIPGEVEVCTMRIRILVPDGVHYGIGGYAPNYASSVYVNGEWIYDQGKPALTLEDEQSSEAYRLISAQPMDGVIEVVVQTSSFANVGTSGGMGLYIGDFELARIYYTRVIAQDVIVMSAYILLALVSLLLFLVLPSYKATVWLSLLSLLWAVRVGLKSRKILLTLFPDHTWNFVFKTEVITSPLTILLLTLVLHSVFTGALPKWLRAVILGGSAIMALAVVVLPWPTFLGHSRWSNPPIYWSLAVMLGFIVFSMWRTKTKPTLSQIIILVGMGAVVLAFMWDERYFGNKGFPFSISQPMMLVFTMFMLTAAMLETMQKTVQREVQLAHTVEMQEMELMENRIDIMLSQIQPHFLYNSLTAIGKLCDIDAKKAKVAVTDFADYLRGNLDSVGERKLIYFEDELDHVEAYLALEQLRYKERLRVVIEADAGNFVLPPLTVQPLVENAVQHGLMEKKEGGTVCIRTELTEREVRVTVTDDGVGFDPAVQKNDGHTHIGIENVRGRISAMCGGSLEITSAPGMGTTAVIIIPRNTEEGSL